MSELGGSVSHAQMGWCDMHKRVLVAGAGARTGAGI